MNSLGSVGNHPEPTFALSPSNDQSSCPAVAIRLQTFFSSRGSTSLERRNETLPSNPPPPCPSFSAFPAPSRAQRKRGPRTARQTPRARAQSSMASSSVQYPFPAGAPLPPYEELKEEHDLGLIERNVPVTSAVVHVGPHQVYGQPAGPRDHVVWSIFTTLYCNFCCLGLMALAFSVKARDRKVVGDHSGARSYGSTAKCLNITALILQLLFAVLMIILFASGVIAINNMMHSGV